MRRGRRRRTGVRPSGTGPTPQAQPQASRPGFLLEEYGRLLLLREPSDEVLGPADMADLTRSLEADPDDTVTVVAGADETSAADLWSRLAALLDTLRDDGVGTVRLAMSGTGDDRPGLPSVARRIADTREFDVIAPDGMVLGIPGGGLFVHDGTPHDGTPRGGTADRQRGWWRFSPGTPPVPLGPRQPAPGWQPDVGGLPSRTRNGCVVEQIPAGVLVRPGHARAPRPGDLCYAVPVDRHDLLVVLGVPDGDEVGTDDVADVVTALPAAAHTALRLAPGGRQDVLGVGQDIAGLVDAEVVVHSGLPLLTGSGSGFASGPGTGQRETVRATTVGADGAPCWQPFVDSVVCTPGASSPRLLRWSPPSTFVPGPGDAGSGVLRLSDGWQVAATRAGLWIGGTDASPPALAATAVSPRGPEIEVGLPGEPLDRSLWPVLEKLLDGLPPGVPARARVHVHGTAADGGRELRRLAARYEVRSLRFAAFGTTALTAPVHGEPRQGSPSGNGDGDGPGNASGPTSRPEPGATGAGTPASAGARTLRGSVSPVPVVAPDAQGVVAPDPRRPVARDTHGDGAAVPNQPSTTPRSVPTTAAIPTSATSSAASLPSMAAAVTASVAPAGATRRSGDTEVETTAPASGGGPDTRPEDPAPPGPPIRPVLTSTAPRAAEARPRAAEARPHPAEPRPASPARPAAAQPAPQSIRTTPAPPSTTPARPLPPTPFLPGHRSTQAERAAFRVLADLVWDRQAAAVTRAFTRMPALRGHEQEAARADLIALLLYLRTPGGPLGHEELDRCLRAGDSLLLPYAACVTSALRRLPSFRGPVLRGAGSAGTGSAGTATAWTPAPGTTLRDPAPVSALPNDAEGPSVASARYAILSVTGRRVRQLFDATGAATAKDEVVFAPGTAFRVLDVRAADPSPLVLLRELAVDPAAVLSSHAQLDDQDRTALARLDEALAQRPSGAVEFEWPGRCAGPLGLPDHRDNRTE